MQVLININEKVEVKLTEHGREILRKEVGIGVQWYREEGGWTEFQLWDLMRIFGQHLWNGCDVPFETDIRLIKKV